MKPSNLIAIVGLFICCLICLICAAVPAVSAETFDETFSEYTVNVYEFTYNTGSNDFRFANPNVLSLHLPQHPANYNGLRFCSFESNKVHIKKDGAYLTTHNQIPCIFTGASTGNTYNVLMSVTTSLSAFGAYQKTYITFEFLDYADILSISDNYLKLTFPDSTYTVSIDSDYHNPTSGSTFWSLSVTPTITSSSGDTNNEIRIGGYSASPSGYVEPTGQKSRVITNAIWENNFASEYGDLFSQITLTRKNHYSTLNIYDLNENLIFTEYSNSDLDLSISYPQYMLNLISPSNTNYNRTLSSGEAADGRVSVLASVKNIQDYSVIGDSTISFVSDTENITRTMPNGYDLFTLATDTWYNVSATAAGFTAQQEYESNLWTGNSAIDVWMIPITDESNETVQMNWYVSESNPAGPGTLRISDAVISINSKRLLTDSSGYASTILNRSGSIFYTVKKDGYNTYTRSFSPNWESYTFPTIDEHITLLKIGEPIGEVTPVPTPDTRTSDQKAESAFNILFENLESIVQLAVLVLIISLIGMLAGGGKKK